MIRVLDGILGTGVDRGIPTASAIPIADGAGFLFGNEALQSNSSTHLLLVNWKLLLGKTGVQLSKDRMESPTLDQILNRYSLDEIAIHYFGHVLSAVSKTAGLRDKPQCIVGIPSASETDSAAARERYKRVIRQAFRKLDYPKPCFFPEPFAVFQFHLNRGDIADIGRPQNVMILDIGGGTSNVCVIQTSGHGRLARGGINHTPHGVRTIEIGGSTIDQKLLDRVVKSTRVRDPNALIKIAVAKEYVSGMLNRAEAWQKLELRKSITRKIDLGDQGEWSLSGEDLSIVVERDFWPGIRALIHDCLDAVATQQNFVHPISPLDVVIFAGGTCQAEFIRALFLRDFGTHPVCERARPILSRNYHSAVATGLAIEACANNRLHEMRPTRIAPYIQTDLYIQAGHDAPQAIKTKPLSENPFTGSAEGLLLPAGTVVSDLVGRKLQWQISLKQKPDKIWFQFVRGTSPEYEEIDAKRSIKVKKKDEQPGQQCRTSLLFNDDGVADVGFQTWYGSEGAFVSHEACRLDLHDLHGIEGEMFVGLDFGTSSTLASYVNVKDVGFAEALPSNYVGDDGVVRRAREIEQAALSLLSATTESSAILQEFDDQILADYVYHSNRIEGSSLSRGQTRTVLDAISDDPAAAARSIADKIDSIDFIDEKGEVRTAYRPIKDGVAAVNLRDAFNYVRDAASARDNFTSFRLKEIHSLITRGDEEAHPGKFRSGMVRISQTSFVPPEATQVPLLVDQMVESWTSGEFETAPAIYRAARGHAHFVSIHPFHDGNGRLARLLANFFLWRDRLPGIMLPWENRDRYYDALEECNSSEVTKRGNLTDLLSLFCDLFEDSIERIKYLRDARASSVSTASSAVADSTVIDSNLSKSKRLNDLLSRIGAQKRSIDLQAQYENFGLTFSSMLADVRQSCDLLDRTFRDEWGGAAKLREYSIIDFDTYRDIRGQRPYSRTWYFATGLRMQRRWHDLVYFFGSASARAREIDDSLKNAVSLFVGRYDVDRGRHVNAHNESWSRIKEVSHNGVNAFVIRHANSRFEAISNQDPTFGDWFAMIVEDAVTNLEGMSL